MATDLQAAIEAYWDANASLVASGLTPLRYATAPGASYPYATFVKVGGKVQNRTFIGSYLDVDSFRFSVTSNNEAAASALAAVVEAQLDAIGVTPLIFDDGTQVVWLRSGDGNYKTKRGGTDGSPHVFIVTLTYLSKVARSS